MQEIFALECHLCTALLDMQLQAWCQQSSMSVTVVGPMCSVWCYTEKASRPPPLPTCSPAPPLVGSFAPLPLLRPAPSSFRPPPFPPLPSHLPLLRSTLCARGWPSAAPDDGPPPGGRCAGALCVPTDAGGVYGVVRLSPPPQPARLYCSLALQRAALAEKIW